jgi:PDZ domain
VFDKQNTKSSAAPLPPGGLLLTLVVPGSNAAQSGLEPNDVLLKYNGRSLINVADLKEAMQQSGVPKVIRVEVWRRGNTLETLGGRTFEREVRGGPLGVLLADDPAPQAVARLRKLNEQLGSGKDDEYQPLPGCWPARRTLAATRGPELSWPRAAAAATATSTPARWCGPRRGGRLIRTAYSRPGQMGARHDL